MKKAFGFCVMIFVFSFTILFSSCSVISPSEGSTVSSVTTGEGSLQTQNSVSLQNATETKLHQTTELTEPSEQTSEFTSGTGTVMLPETEKNYAKVLQNANDFAFVCYKCDSNGVRIAAEDSYSFFESEDITDAWYFKTLFSPSNAIEEEPYPFDSWWRVTTYSLVLELSTSEGETLEFKFCHDGTTTEKGYMNLRNTVYCDFECGQDVERYVFELTDGELLYFEELFTSLHSEHGENAE